MAFCHFDLFDVALSSSDVGNELSSVLGVRKLLMIMEHVLCD